MSGKIISMMLFVLCGCVSSTTGVQPSKIVSDFYRKYITTTEQISQFKNYSLENQYELFAFGNHVIHPPATYLALPFAQQGAVIVPFLKMKLTITTDDATVRDIALIFSEVARLKLYDFSKDAELMNLLDDKINKMQGIWKPITFKFLSEIQTAK